MSAKIDVGQHVLVPKHEILSKEKVQEVLDRYKIFPHQLPFIKSSDPAAKAIGAKPGDLLEITRNSATAGKAVVYRYVIK